jgi:hypothetical protein
MLTNSTIISENLQQTPIIVLKKRGRKSKKELQEIQALQAAQTLSTYISNINENIVVQIEDNISTQLETSCIDEIINSDDDDVDNELQDNSIQLSALDDKPIAKKRGRKPKGGKIVQQIVSLTNIKESKPNIILHLKCSIKDLSLTNLFGTNLDSYTFNKPSSTYEAINSEVDNFNKSINAPAKLTDYECDTENNLEADIPNNKDNDIREIWKKLKVLEHNLHINNTCDKKSACFWDTCEFDNPPIYIPKYYMNNTCHVYGCFCSPECAVAHLMKENIDSSIKFERYQLINHIYSKVFNYTKNIKPAPDPYYMLEKYCGNLTTQEYRSLLRNERLFLVVDKPLTRIMPELHEDNDDFIINNKIIPSNAYQIKKKLQKKQTKTNILSERFGLTNN